MQAQTGGKGVYTFLNLSNSARISALGGNNVSVYDDDLNTSFYNPSLLNAEMSGQLIMNYVNYFAGINFGYLAYGFHNEKYGTFSAGLHYLNYGEFTAADENGTVTGTFGAADYALNLIWAKELYPGISAGINLKPIYSHLEKYSSVGLTTDIGFSYFKKEQNFSVSLVLKNFGMQITPYRAENREPVRTDLNAGISKRLAHAPFRLNLTAHRLFRWNLSKPQEDTRISIYDETNQEPKFNIQKALDNAMRHLIVGVEFLPMKNFYVALGYNHLRRAEMGIKDLGGFSGISWGFGLKLKRLGLSYGRASYHLAGGSNHFSVYYRIFETNKEKIITE
jgi:hypothetical protein